MWFAATALVLTGFAAAFWFYPNRAGPFPGPERWQQVTNFPDSATDPAISPDGHMLACVAPAAGS
jgi:hypothetical protein